MGCVYLAEEARVLIFSFNPHGIAPAVSTSSTRQLEVNHFQISENDDQSSIPSPAPR
jgi:hypothetical protein